MFVHSTSGHVVEQDLSATSPTKKESEATAESAVPPQEQEVVGKDKDKGAESEGTAYNCTMDKSLAMEMTLYESEVETEEERANVENVSEEVGDTPYIEQVRDVTSMPFCYFKMSLSSLGDTKASLVPPRPL